MIQILHNLALFWVKNANFFAIFFSENIFKIITSVPGHPHPHLFTSIRHLFRLDPATLWSLASPKLLPAFSLWDLLLEKLRHRRKSVGPVSRKDSLEFLLAEVHSLLAQLSKLLLGCCDAVDKVKMLLHYCVFWRVRCL
jgi:hypothetical protein